MKSAMTPIFNAEPCLKSTWLTAWNEASFRPSSPTANSTAGLEQDPKSRAARLTLAADAALHASSCLLQSDTEVPARDPEFAALEQRVFWTAHERWRAAPALTKLLPFTTNGRVPAEEMTGGAAPPRVPVKVWTLAIIH